MSHTMTHYKSISPTRRTMALFTILWMKYLLSNSLKVGFEAMLCGFSFLNRTSGPNFDIVQFIWKFFGWGFDLNSFDFLNFSIFILTRFFKLKNPVQKWGLVLCIHYIHSPYARNCMHSKFSNKLKRSLYWNGLQ